MGVKRLFCLLNVAANAVIGSRIDHSLLIVRVLRYKRIDLALGVVRIAKCQP